MRGEKGRPRQTRGPAPQQATPQDQPAAEDTAPDRQAQQTLPLPVAPDLRRRHRAANRCEPLDDGRRDPLEPVRSSTRRLHVEVRGHTAWLYGGRVAWLLDSANVPRQRDLRMPGVWTCPASRVDDVVTYAEHLEGRYVTVERIEP